MHHRLSLWTTTTLVVAWLAPAPGSAQTRGLQPTDFYNEVGAGQVAISPDDVLAPVVPSPAPKIGARRAPSGRNSSTRLKRPRGRSRATISRSTSEPPRGVPRPTEAKIRHAISRLP